PATARRSQPHARSPAGTAGRRFPTLIALLSSECLRRNYCGYYDPIPGPVYRAWVTRCLPDALPGGVNDETPANCRGISIALHHGVRRWAPADGRSGRAWSHDRVDAVC